MTIACSPTRKQISDGGMFAGGIAERARILKNSLSVLMTHVATRNVLVLLLNQVISNIGSYAGGYSSSGGNALAHDIHVKLSVNGGNTSYDEGIYAVSKTSYMTITKSKISPIMAKSGIPIVLDITKGGIIDRVNSVLNWVSTLGVISQAGGWYYINDDYYEAYHEYFEKVEILQKKFRWNALVDACQEDDHIIDIFTLIWTDLVMKKYSLQRSVCQQYHDDLVLKLKTYYKVSETGSLVTDNLLSDLQNILGSGTEDSIDDTSSDNNDTGDESNEGLS